MGKNIKSFVDMETKWGSDIEGIRYDIERIEPIYAELLKCENPDDYADAVDNIIKEAKEEFERRLQLLERWKTEWAKAIQERKTQIQTREYVKYFRIHKIRRPDNDGTGKHTTHRALTISVIKYEKGRLQETGKVISSKELSGKELDKWPDHVNSIAKRHKTKTVLYADNGEWKERNGDRIGEFLKEAGYTVVTSIKD